MAPSTRVGHAARLAPTASLQGFLTPPPPVPPPRAPPAPPLRQAKVFQLAHDDGSPIGKVIKVNHGDLGSKMLNNNVLWVGMDREWEVGTQVRRQGAHSWSQRRGEAGKQAWPGAGPGACLCAVKGGGGPRWQACLMRRAQPRRRRRAPHARLAAPLWLRTSRPTPSLLRLLLPTRRPAAARRAAAARRPGARLHEGGRLPDCGQERPGALQRHAHGGAARWAPAARLSRHACLVRFWQSGGQRGRACHGGMAGLAGLARAGGGAAMAWAGALVASARWMPPAILVCSYPHPSRV